MTREIKFRAKIMNSVQNAGQWRYWDVFEEPSDISVLNKDTLGEFTGLTDKNGKEIYEGDIIEITHQTKYKSKHVVEDLIYTHEFCYVNSIDFYLMGEVIGNIYDNTDLVRK